MALFEPSTVIYFLADTGVDDENKPYFADDGGMQGYMLGKVLYQKSGCSYQRGDERPYAAVQINYYNLLRCDYMAWQNTDTANKWLYARITGLEWVNPNLTRVYFEVDAFCSFCGSIDWNTSVCLVEREHVQDDWSGGNPNWGVQGVDEGIGMSADTCVTYYSRSYTPDTYVVISPYDSSGEPNFQGTAQNGIYEGMTQVEVTSPEGVASYLNQLATSARGNINNVVGIFSVPHEFIDGQVGVDEVTAPWVMKGNINNAKCFCSQFCCVTVESMVGQNMTYKPELLPSTQQFQFNYVARGIGATIGFVVAPSTYAGMAWPETVDLGYSYSNPPQSAFAGDALAQNLTTAALTGLARVAGGAIQGASVGGGAGALMGAADSAIGVATEMLSKLPTMVKNSAVVGGSAGSSDVNLAVAVSGYGYKIRVYIPKDSSLAALDSFFDRFGYRVMALKVPNRNTRPCWNYVKCVEAHVGGDIPFFYRKQIENMLNRGVTFWNVGARSIGDYSNPQANKG